MKTLRHYIFSYPTFGFSRGTSLMAVLTINNEGETSVYVATITDVNIDAIRADDVILRQCIDFTAENGTWVTYGQALDYFPTLDETLYRKSS